MKQIYILIGLLISITLFSCGGGSGDNGLYEKKYRIKTLQFESDRLETKHKSTYKFNYDSDGNLNSYRLSEKLYGDYIGYLLIFTYNKDGKLLTQGWYGDRDDKVATNIKNYPECSEAYTYDSKGLMLSHDSYCDEFITTTYTYDSKGNKLSENYYQYGYSEYETPDKTTYTYDSKGNRITEKFVSYDGSRTSALTYTYDAKGNKLTEENSESYTYDNEFNSHIIHTYIYNSNSKLLTDSYDKDVDGVADAIRTYIYNSNSKLLTDSYDEDADGVANTIRTYTYDTNGNMLTDSNDTDADGIADEIRTYTYDTKGNKLKDSYDKDADGIMDTVRAFTYNSEGKIKIETFDKNADGTVNYKRTYTYERTNIVKEISPLIWKPDIEYEWESLTAIQ